MTPTGTEKLERRPTQRPPTDWQNGPRWPLWLGSTCVHVGLFLLLAWFWQPLARGTGDERDRPIGIAIVHQQAGVAEYFTEVGGSGQGDPQAETASPLATAVAAAAAAPSVEGVSLDELVGEFASSQTSTLGGEQGQGGGESSGISGLGDSGTGKGREKGAKTKTTVFGIEGAGSSFVYVFDRSESMNGYDGAPLRLAKREMTQSLSTLTSVHQFQIVFYNDAPSPYRGSLSKTRGLIFATDTEKASAQHYIKGIQGTGGTEHFPALRMALNLGSDVIFFLTDAADPSPNMGELAELIDRCVGRGTTIHSIEFGTGPSLGSDRWIERLAIRTGGKYRYLDVTQLDR